MRHPVTDVALLSYIAKKKLGTVSYTEATKACKSSSSASRALHQLIQEGLLDPKPKLMGLRYVTQYVVTQKGKQVAELALQLTQLREAARLSRESQTKEEVGEEVENSDEKAAQVSSEEDAGRKKDKDKDATRVEEMAAAPQKLQMQATVPPAKKSARPKKLSPPSHKKK
jgi:DNA-binding PadR family transcriptional regulator